MRRFVYIDRRDLALPPPWKQPALARWEHEFEPGRVAVYGEKSRQDNGSDSNRSSS
jgi:hypothetical protein